MDIPHTHTHTSALSPSSGLAGALAALKDKGELGPKIMWAGRNKDKSREALMVGVRGVRGI